MLRKFYLAAVFCLAAAVFGTAPKSAADPWRPSTTATAEQAQSATAHTVQLGPYRIGAGEWVEYTTVSASFADWDLPAGMYAGELTVELQGPIVVEAGGSLSIGTLSLGGSEASPLLRGTLTSQGIILVEAGGSLSLTDVAGDFDGEGWFVVQEPGASVELLSGDLDEGLIQWAPPSVNNQHHAPDDVWLPEGTPLTAEALPATLKTYLQYQGKEEYTDLPLAWDLSDYDGRTTGTVTLTGHFLDENGTALDSTCPLTVTVHWYATSEIVVTGSSWNGSEACTATLFLTQLPPDAELWGEISTDDGATWQVWPDFELLSDSNTGYAAVFFLEDDTPRLFRLAAVDYAGEQHWVSRGILLPTEDSDDQGGNHGGSLNPIVPERTPQPTATPVPSATPTEQPAAGEGSASDNAASTATPAPEEEVASRITPSAGEEPAAAPLRAQAQQGTAPHAVPQTDPEATPAPIAAAQPSEQPAATGTPAPTANETPETATQAAPPSSGWNLGQAAAVLGGIAVCAGLGAASVVLGKKK